MSIALVRRIAWLTTVTAAAVASPVLAEALAAEAPQASSAIDGSAQRADPAALESGQQGGEIIVTAQKRSERVLDVPIPIAVVSADSLERQGKDSLADYFGSVPGLNFSSVGGGQQTVAIRGLATTALSNTTVAVTIDDVPFGSSSFLALGSTSYPDIDPGILSRIEVLRGPQGTLYGASSIGGVLRFVTRDPDLDAISGQLTIGGSKVDNGALGYNLSGVVSAPVAEGLAVQASGFRRRNPGYITNTLTGECHVNEADVEGGRIAALAALTDDVTLKVSSLLQNTSGEGGPQVDTDADLDPVAGLSQARIAGTDSFRNRIRLHAATLTADLGGVELTSVTGYNIISLQQAQDSSLLYGPFSDLLYGSPAAVQSVRARTRRVTQELRLAFGTGNMFDWLAGVFYSEERSSYLNSVSANEADGSLAGDIVTFDAKSRTREYSAFGNLTVTFSEQFDVQLGGRLAKIRQSYSEIDSGPFLEDPIVTLESYSRGEATTYLVTPRFRLSPSVMLYGRFASGYRPGGLNINAAVSGNPLSFAPDKTYNYEIGAKGALFDNSVTFDASLYYIDWNNIQIQLNNANFELYTANAGGARSTGAELSVEVRPAGGLTVGGNLAYNDAVLTSDFPPESNGLGAKGDRLPFSSKVSWTVFADQAFELADGVEGTIGLSANHVGSRLGEFPSYTPFRIDLPSYLQLDLRAGLTYGTWSLSLYANNLTDKRGLVGGTSSAPAGSGANVIYIQPRTFGASISKTF